MGGISQSLRALSVWRLNVRQRDRERFGALRGDEARQRRDWPRAIEAYRLYLSHRPRDAAVHARLASVLMQMGDDLGAEAALQRAVILRPRDAMLRVRLARQLRRMARPAAAADLYRMALEIEPGLEIARRELSAAEGCREERGWRAGDRLATMERLVDDMKSATRTVEDWLGLGKYPLGAYDAFRRSLIIPSAPDCNSGAGIRVLVDAREGGASAVRATLLSLRRQTRPWRAFVLGDQALMDHPVGSLGLADERIMFGALEDCLSWLAESGDCLLVAPAGVVLAEEALAWLRHGLSAADASGCHADHDLADLDWRDGLRRRHPALFASPSVRDVATCSRPPLVVLMSAALAPTLARGLSAGTAAAEIRRELLLSAFVLKGVAHVPLLLSSTICSDQSARNPASCSDAPGEEKIVVVIPTRDEAAALSKMVDTLIDGASQPENLVVVVADNRSREVQTHRYLEDQVRSGRIICIKFDQPFNWSMINNRVSDVCDQDIIVFANNDMEMLTRGWDDILRRDLSGEIGVVGAKLIYPGGAIQHAGVLFGANDGMPFHDGLGHPEADAGPLDRWARAHPVAAVTGAFLAVRRETFEAVAGFDELGLAVAYNDVDFCLKVRALGLQVLYEPEIRLIHYESFTRGVNDTPEKRAWDMGELSRVYDRWGADFIRDPGRNPHWADEPEHPFSWLRQPRPDEVHDWIRMSNSGAWFSKRNPSSSSN